MVPMGLCLADTNQTFAEVPSSSLNANHNALIVKLSFATSVRADGPCGLILPSVFYVSI